jgi:hypothetical protein
MVLWGGDVGIGNRQSRQRKEKDVRPNKNVS